MQLQTHQVDESHSSRVSLHELLTRYATQTQNDQLESNLRSQTNPSPPSFIFNNTAATSDASLLLSPAAHTTRNAPYIELLSQGREEEWLN
jgi:hypothetical protein